jgi:hypothetical protein
LPDFTGRVQLGRGCTTHDPSVGSHVSHDGHVTWVPPEHVPPAQTAPVVQASGPQFVPSGFFKSVGHALFTPSQFSATSHAPFAGRHSSVRFASAGQVFEVPSQVSATSHVPADGRHGVPAVAATSGGQFGEVPLQLSAASQPPLAVRHTVPELPAGCVQVPVALHTSSVHTLLSVVHGLPGAWKVHVGEQQSPPSHCSVPFTT